MDLDPRHSALDASHALVLAVHDATRFRQGDDHGGLVGRLRGLAVAAARAVVGACREERPPDPGRLREPIDLLRQLDRGISEARATGLLDRRGSREITDLESRARAALRILLTPGHPLGGR